MHILGGTAERKHTVEYRAHGRIRAVRSTTVDDSVIEEDQALGAFQGRTADERRNFGIVEYLLADILAGLLVLQAACRSDIGM